MQLPQFFILSLWLLSVWASPPPQKLVEHFIRRKEGESILSDDNLISKAMKDEKFFFTAFRTLNDDFRLELFINALILNHADFADKLSAF